VLLSISKSLQLTNNFTGKRYEFKDAPAHPGTPLRAPTEKGLVYCCRDTMKGEISLTLKNTQDKTIILEANSDSCGVEIGGHPWFEGFFSPT